MKAGIRNDRAFTKGDNRIKATVLDSIEPGTRAPYRQFGKEIRRPGGVPQLLRVPSKGWVNKGKNGVSAENLSKFFDGIAFHDFSSPKWANYDSL